MLWGFLDLIAIYCNAEQIERTMHSLSFVFSKQLICVGELLGTQWNVDVSALGVHQCVLLAHLLPHLFPSIAGGIRLPCILSPGVSVSLGLCLMCFLYLSPSRAAWTTFLGLFPFSLPLSKWTIWVLVSKCPLDTCLLFVPPTYLPPSLVPLLFIIRFIKDRMKYNS